MALSEHAKIYLKNKYGTTNTKRVTTSVDPLADWNKRWEELKNGSGVPAVQGGPVTITPDLQIQQQAEADFDAALEAQRARELYDATGGMLMRVDGRGQKTATAPYTGSWGAEQEAELKQMRNQLLYPQVSADEVAKAARDLYAETGGGISQVGITNDQLRTLAANEAVEEDILAAIDQQRAKRAALGLSPYASAAEGTDREKKTQNLQQALQAEEDLLTAYQEQLAKRDPASPYANTGFMPVDPTEQTLARYLGESALSGLAGSLEGTRNFFVDLAAEEARNDRFGMLGERDAIALAAETGGAISPELAFTPNSEAKRRATAAQVIGYRDNSKSQALQENLASYNANPQSAVGIAGNVAAGVGGMLPAIGANLLVPGSGSAVMFSSAAGQAASEALKAGATYDEAFTYGVVSGATEIATEKILGGIPGLNKGWADDLLNKGIARISTSPVGRFLIKTGVDALGEGFEEWLSEAIGQYTVRIYDEDERNRSVMDVATEGRDDRLYAALIGALTSLAMQAPTVNANNVAQYNAELTKIRGGIETALVEEGMNAQEAQQTAAAMAEQAQTEIATTTPTQTAQTEAQQTTDMFSAETPQTGVQQPTQQQIEDELVSMVTGEPVPSERLVTVNGEQIERADVDFKPTQKVAAVKRLGNAFGKQVVFVKGFSNGANGATDGNRIFISETTRNPYIEVFNHELTHTLRGAGSWNGFQNYVLEQIRAEKGEGYDAYVQKLRQRYADRGVTLDTTLLNEELVADFVERRLFTDQTAVNELVRQQESVAYRIWSMLRDAVRQLNKNTRLSPEEMAIKKAERMFAKALAQSNNSNIQSSSLKYSIRSMKADLSDGAMQRALTEEREINGVKLPPVFTQEEANRFVENLDHLMDKILPKAKFLDLNETYTKKNRPFNPVKPNSDPLYKVSLDFSTVCKKRIVTQMVMEHLNTQLGRALSSETQYAITQRLRELQTEYSELQVACAICYVEAARLKSPKVINQFLGDRRSAITNYYASKNEENRAAARDAAAQVKIAAGYDAVTPNKNLPANVKKAATNASRSVRENYVPSEAEEAQTSAAEIMDSSVFLTADGLTNLAINNHDVYDAFVSKVRSATRSKSIETSVPYYYGDSEAMMSDTLIEQMNRENGMRYQSWSDFELKHLLDNIMAVAEMSARNAKMHSYTKVPEFVIVNGKTGMMINLSLIPEGKTGIDAGGNLLFSSTEGMPRETANSLRDTYHETAGTIAIGVSDEQIVKLLESEDIDYVIPYHISGLNKALRKIAKIHEWKDYTGSQNEKAVKGSFQGEKPKFSDWFNDALLDKAQQEGWSGVETMQQAAESYKRLCIERGYTPKFPQFMEEPNYWKLLIDRRMVDGQGNIIIQQAVRPNFEFERIGEIVDAAEDPNTDELVNEILEIVYQEAQTGGITRISNKAAVRGEEAEIAELGRKFSESLENQPQITQFSISDPNADGRQRNEIDIDAALNQQYGALSNAKYAVANKAKQVFDIAEATDDDDPRNLSGVKEMLNDVSENREGIVNRPENLDDVEMAQMLKGKVRGFRGYNLTPDRVVKQVSGGVTMVENWLRKNVLDPLYEAKAEYSRRVLEHRNDLYEKVVKGQGVKAGSRESAAVMWYGEGKKIAGVRGDGTAETVEYTLNDLKRDFPTRWRNIVAVERYCRAVYDEYFDLINEVREKIYPNVDNDADRALRMARGRVAGAFADLEAAQTALMRDPQNETLRDNVLARQEVVEMRQQQLRKLEKEVDSGDYFRRKRLLKRKDYFHHFSEMQGTFAQIKDIMSSATDIDSRLAGISDFTQPKTKWQGIFQKQGKNAYVEDAIGGMLKYFDQAEYAINIDPVIAQNRGFIKMLAENTSETKNANGFIEWMMDWTNDLAGKTNPFDRAMQKAFSRSGMKVLDKINGVIKGSKIAGNISSAVAQFFNVQNAFLYVTNPASWTEGARNYGAALKSGSDAQRLMSQSAFLRERYLDNSLLQFDPLTLKNSPERFASAMMEFGDKEMAKLIWFTAHADGQRKRVADPVKYADEITRKSVGGRGIGEQPILQKSQITKLLAPFQLEVSNSWYALQETIKDKNAAGILGFLASGYIMNAAAEAIRGSSVSMDLLGAVIDEIRNWIDEDDEEEKTTAGQKAAGLATRLAGETLSNMPYGSLIGTMITSGDDDLAEDLFGESDPTRFGVGNVGISALVDPALELVTAAKEGTSPDWGELVENTALNFVPYGNQINKTIDAAQATWDWATPFDDRPAGSYTDSGNLRFAVDKSNPVSVGQGLLFGQYATKEGREYIDSGAMPNASKTQRAQAMYEAGIALDEALAFINSTSGIKAADAPGALYDEFGDDLTADQYADLWNAYKMKSWTSKINPFEIAADAKVSLDDFLDVYEEYNSGKENQTHLYDVLASSGLTVQQQEDIWEAYMEAKGWKKTYDEIRSEAYK